MAGSWRQSEVLAWTEGDGPGRPPKGPNRTVSLALAGTLGVIFAGIMASDTLCPEHRAWVVGLGTAAIAGTVLAIAGLLRGWAMAPFLTLGAAGAGVAVGILDAAHSPTRGRLLTLGFAVVCLGAAALAARALTLARWDRALADSLRPVTSDQTAPGEAAPDQSAPAPGAAPLPAPQSLVEQ